MSTYDRRRQPRHAAKSRVVNPAATPAHASSSVPGMSNDSSSEAAVPSGVLQAELANDLWREAKRIAALLDDLPADMRGEARQRHKRWMETLEAFLKSDRCERCSPT